MSVKFDVSPAEFIAASVPIEVSDPTTPSTATRMPTPLTAVPMAQTTLPVDIVWPDAYLVDPSYSAYWTVPVDPTPRTFHDETASLSRGMEFEKPTTDASLLGG